MSIVQHGGLCAKLDNPWNNCDCGAIAPDGGAKDPEVSPRASVLREAESLITGDRNKTYGSPTQNFANTAALLNVQFAHKLSEPFTASDIAVIMIQLKMARLIASPDKRDTWLDITGYGACGWEAFEGTQEAA